MTKERMICVGLAATICLVAAIILVAFLSEPANTGFRDTAAVLAFVSGAALAIERVIEVFWTLLGGIVGAYWPLNTVSRQVETMVAELNKSLEPFYKLADEKIGDAQHQVALTETEINDIKGNMKDELPKLKLRIQELEALAPDNQRVQLLIAAASQSVGYLNSKYNKLFPSIEHATQVADSAINGLQDFLATFKDNPGRRLISIYLGAILGLVVAGAFGLDIFQAVLEEPSQHPRASIILTGILIGLGSNPTHEVIRAIQEYKKTRKGENTAKPDLPSKIG